MKMKREKNAKRDMNWPRKQRQRQKNSVIMFFFQLFLFFFSWISMNFALSLYPSRLERNAIKIRAKEIIFFASQFAFCRLRVNRNQPNADVSLFFIFYSYFFFSKRCRKSENGTKEKKILFAFLDIVLDFSVDIICNAQWLTWLTRIEQWHWTRAEQKKQKEAQWVVESMCLCDRTQCCFYYCI